MTEKPCKDTDKKSRREEKDESFELEKRAAVYGLSTKELLDEDLVIPPGRKVVIDGEHRSQQGVVTLTPKSIDDVKNWIGVPDDTAAKQSCCSPLPTSNLQAVSSAAELRKLEPEAARNLRGIANAYVNGDLRRVANYKPVLEYLLDRANITGIFLRRDIDIHRGATLEIGRNNRVLFARHIRIWTGGRLIIRGDAKIDCVSITGGVTFTVDEFVTSAIALGRYVEMEVANG